MWALSRMLCYPTRELPGYVLVGVVFRVPDPQLELDSVADAKISPHLQILCPLWSWLSDLQLLDLHLGRGSGITMVGSLMTFLQACARDPELYFLFHAPSAVCRAGTSGAMRTLVCVVVVRRSWWLTKLRPEWQSMFRDSNPLPDGTTWAVAAGEGLGVALCPPGWSPAYPVKVLYILTGLEHRPGTIMYCQPLRIVSPSNTMQHFAGLSFVLAHVGLLGLRVPAA